MCDKHCYWLRQEKLRRKLWHTNLNTIRADSIVSYEGENQIGEFIRYILLYGMPRMSHNHHLELALHLTYRESSGRSK